jgi:hypothetical protein
VPRHASGSPMRRTWRANSGRPRKPRANSTMTKQQATSTTIIRTTAASRLTQLTSSTRPIQVMPERRTRSHASRCHRPCAFSRADDHLARASSNPSIAKPNNPSPSGLGRRSTPGAVFGLASQGGDGGVAEVSQVVERARRRPAPPLRRRRPSWPVNPAPRWRGAARGPCRNGRGSLAPGQGGGAPQP